MSTKRHPELFYSLHSLLETLRRLQICEEKLCSLFHEVQTSGRVSPALSRDLLSLLEEMPTVQYRQDVAAIEKTLATSGPAARRAQDTKRAVPKRGTAKRGRARRSRSASSPNVPAAKPEKKQAGKKAAGTERARPASIDAKRARPAAKKTAAAPKRTAPVRSR